ncbi:MAG: AsmA family protein [bacterium]|nr:AsmA family protein [bacterium]
MKTTLKIVGILVVMLLVVIGVGLLALPQILSTDLARNKITQVIEQKTGRKLIITGDTSFKFYPDIGVSLNDISLSNPPRMKGAPLIKMTALRASLKLIPLFKGQFEVVDITLIKPHFILLVDKKGYHNWDFNMGASGSDGTDNSSSGRRVTLRSVTIKNGFVHYINTKDNVDEKLEAINITLAQKLPSRSINTKGNLRWHNEILNISSKIDTPDQLFVDQPSKIFIKLSSRFTDSEYEGMVTLGDKPTIDGSLISRTNSVRQLAKFLGHKLPAGSGFGNLKLKTVLKANANQVQFATSQFLFDNMDMKASGTIDLRPKQPAIVANIEIDRLDLNPYLNDEDNGSANANNDAIDLSAIKAVDGTFKLKTNGIIYQKAHLETGQFDISLVNGRADVTIRSLTLYRGSAIGNLVLDGSRSTAQISGNLTLKNVLIGAILRDFAGFDKLSGKGSLSGKFAVKGANVKDLKKSLKGNLKLSLSKGRIDGFNLARKVEEYTGNTVPGSGTGRDGKERTAYDKMSASFKTSRGIARTTDFLVTGKFFKIRANGRINIVNETLNMRVAPHLFIGDWSFAPPLKVTGPWAKPKPGFDALAFWGGSGTIVRSLRGLASADGLADSALLKRRGLKNDKEIEAYLEGKKINTRGDTPATQEQPADNTDSAEPASPVGGLLDGNQSHVDNLLKKVLP